MKSGKFTTIAAGLVLTAICAVGTITAFAADGNAQATEPTVAAQETVEAQEPSADTKDTSAKKDKSEKVSMTFVGIDAVAADVLGVSEESLAGLNHANELFAKLTEAGKVDEFKTALTAAKQAQYAAKAGLGKFSANELAEKLAGYTQVINNWDGSTELIVSSSKTTAK